MDPLDGGLLSSIQRQMILGQKTPLGVLAIAISSSGDAL
jgi:hypothetical protein